MSTPEKIVVGSILAIAIAMRFVGLGWAPPGLLPEEALNGNIATQALRNGEFNLFYPEHGGREGLFINLQAIAIHVFGNTVEALRVVPATIGILTLVGLYLLVRRMFDDWRIAALAATAMATGFWHVDASRIGLGAIMAPLASVWSLYYLYKGIETNRLSNWSLAGIMLGIGWYVDTSFRLIPIVFITTLVAYAWGIRQVFSHTNYHATRRQLLGGMALMVGVGIAVALPILALETQQGGVRTATLGTNSLAATLSALTLSNAALLLWPLGVFFALGLGRLLWKIGHAMKTRGHPTTVHTLLVSWVGVGVASQSILLAPAAYITIAVGLHWAMVLLERWIMAHDARMVCIPASLIPGSHGHSQCYSRSNFLVGLSVVVLMGSLGLVDAYRYFEIWAHYEQARRTYDARSVELAGTLNTMPPATLKYVVLPRQSSPTSDAPLAAQSVMFLTDTFSRSQQDLKHIHYLTPEEFTKHRYKPGSFVVQLAP